MSIEVKNLSFSYGQKNILHNVSFSVKKGEFLSILGPNGAGKSTLFRCILGLLPNYTGEVMLNGKNRTLFSVKEAARQIAYIPQSSHTAFNYSVLDIVLMGRANNVSVFNSPNQDDIKACLSSLTKVGISHLKEQCFHKL